MRESNRTLLRLARALLMLTAAGASWNAAAEESFACESVNGSYRHCDVPPGVPVRIVRQLSKTDCVQGSSWGLDNRGVWVDGGCRAEFAYGGATVQTIARNPRGGTLVCQSVNYQYAFCPADTRGRAAVTRQLSKIPCNENDSWGTTPTGVWVNKGCSAEFAYGRIAAGPAQGAGWGAGGAQQVFTCTSYGPQPQYCQVPTQSGVRLVAEQSFGRCVPGQTWGYDANGVWVANGCSAQFALGGGYGGNNFNNAGGGGLNWSRSGMAAAGSLTCESVGDSYNYCRANTGGYAELRRQLSRSDCQLGSSWGFDAGGIWVDRGCRGVFVFGGR
ncbi:MAG: DUF3011 domain-containing protein [Gammaproteobacteria bacterium]